MCLKQVYFFVDTQTLIHNRIQGQNWLKSLSLTEPILNLTETLLERRVLCHGLMEPFTRNAYRAVVYTHNVSNLALVHTGIPIVKFHGNTSGRTFIILLDNIIGSYMKTLCYGLQDDIWCSLAYQVSYSRLFT